MTVVAFASLKGAPGVTTLACLVGATWPEGRRPVVVECDPCGGDLAARFRLSSRIGWSSFNAARRRGESNIASQPHLQQLPGGLEVLVGARESDVCDATRSMAALLSSATPSAEDTWDILLDLGRLVPDEPTWSAWLGHSDSVVIAIRNSAPAALQVRERTPSVVKHCRGRLALALVGGGSYSATDVQEFTGLPVLEQVPFDSRAAAAAAGEHGGGRRLRRSPLVSSASCLAAILAGGPILPDDPDPVLTEDGTVPHSAATVVAHEVDERRSPKPRQSRKVGFGRTSQEALK